MRLNEITRDHFERPRNVGTLEAPTHQARATNPVCGDYLTLHLHVDQGMIREARFQAEGCAPTYAAASILTERIIGRESAWAAALTASDLIAWLGGVPPGKDHAASLAIGVLKDALRGGPGNG